MNDRQLARISIVTGFAAIVLLAVTSIAHADVRNWADIINEATCTVTGSGSSTTVHVATVDGLEQVAELAKGERWVHDGPVSGEVRVWLKRDLYDSHDFDFDCQEVPPSSTTTTTSSLPTTTTAPPTTSTPVPTETTTTTEPTTTTQRPDTSSTAPPTSVPSTISTSPTPTSPPSDPPSTTTEDPCGPNTLPCTGPTTDPLAWAVVGAALLTIGAAAVRAEQVTRRERKQ